MLNGAVKRMVWNSSWNPPGLYSSDCQRQWALNKCAPAERVPGVEKLCLQYEECMRKSQVGLIAILAESMGEMLETFLFSLSLSAFAKLGLLAMLVGLLWKIK